MFCSQYAGAIIPISLMDYCDVHFYKINNTYIYFIKTTEYNIVYCFCITVFNGF